jgi:hypothetical protein
LYNEMFGNDVAQEVQSLWIKIAHL